MFDIVVCRAHYIFTLYIPAVYTQHASQSSSYSFWRSQQAVAAKLQASIKHGVRYNFSGLRRIMERDRQMYIFLKFCGLPVVEAEDVLQTSQPVTVVMSPG